MALVFDLDHYLDRRTPLRTVEPRPSVVDSRGAQARTGPWMSATPRLRLIVPPAAASRVTARPPRGDLTHAIAMAALRRVHLRIVEQHPPA